MRRNAFLCATLVAAVVGTTAFAQSNGVPAEFPPSSFSGNQFIDSKGCAFIRAGISGNVTWVPRVTRTRVQICNFQPTFAPEPVAAPEPMVAPIEDTQIVAAAMPSPQARPSVAPVAVETISATPAPLVIERPQVLRATTPPRVVAPTPVAAPTPQAEIPRMTRAQVCAAMAVGNTRYINAETGQPVRCPSSTLTMTRTTIAVPASPSGPSSPTVATAPSTPSMMAPVSAGGASAAPRAQAKPQQSLFSAKAIPASNPVVTSRRIPNPPAGYKRVWNDGRINLHRGIPNAQHGASGQ